MSRGTTLQPEYLGPTLGVLLRVTHRKQLYRCAASQIVSRGSKQRGTLHIGKTMLYNSGFIIMAPCITSCQGPIIPQAMTHQGFLSAKFNLR